DDYATKWGSHYREACEATRLYADQSEEVLDLRMACLNERLAGLGSLADVFGNASRDVVERAVGAAAALTPLDRCDDVQQLRSVIQPPDPAIRARVDRLRVELMNIKSLHDAGLYHRALSRLEPVSNEALELGYKPLQAEVAVRFGWTDMELSHFKEGEDSLER